MAYKRKFQRKFNGRKKFVRKTRLPFARKPVDKGQNRVIAKVVKDVNKLKARPEVKHAPFDVSDAHEVQTITSGQSGSSIAPTFYCLGDLVRSVSNGSIASDRVGSKINVVRWFQTIRLTMPQTIFGMTAYSQPAKVRVIIARMKNVDPTLTTSPTFTQISTLLRYDNTASQANIGPSNTYAAMELPINTAQWAVAYDKKHFVQPTLAASTDASGGTWQEWSLHQGVKSEINIRMNMKKIVGKVIKFDTASSPSNMKYWFVFHIAVPTGYRASNLATECGLSTMYVESVQRMSYTDS